GASCRVQNRFDIRQRLPGLRLEAILQLASFSVPPRLRRHEYQVTGANGLRIGACGRGSRVRGYANLVDHLTRSLAERRSLSARSYIRSATSGISNLTLTGPPRNGLRSRSWGCSG